MYEEIFKLIEKGELDKAQEMIDKTPENDPKRYNISGLIYYQKKELEKAKEEFEKGLKIDAVDSDLLFNYGYLLKEMNQEKEAWRYLMRIHKKDWATYDMLGDIEFKNRSKLSALRFYKKAAELTDSPEEMKKKFLDMRNNIKQDTKIAFLCLPGLDNFLKDIVETFSLGYDVKLVVTTDGNQIAEAIKWSDIVWLEWANDLAIFATNNVPEIQNKKVVCRLHGYEAFNGNVLSKINWNFINRMIFVADHVREDAYESCPQMKSVPYTMVYNAIDLDKFTFNKRTKGKRICFSGYVNYKKNPMLMIQILNKLLKIDEGYKIEWVGKHQDIRIAKYLQHILRDMGIEDKFIFHDWTDNINGWLEDKHYFLSTSIHEGYGVAIMEAMAKGIKPIIHNFYEARGFYPDTLIYNTIDEAVEKITEQTYDSEGYRRFIEDNYSLEKQIDLIEKILKGIEKSSLTKRIYFSNFENEGTQKLKIKNSPDYTYALRYDKRNKRKIQIILDSLTEIYDSAMDIGCNQGYIIETLLKKQIVKRGYGLDLDKTLVNKTLLNNSNFKFYEADITNFSFPENYDLILYLSVHHHIFGKYGKQKAFEILNEIIDHCNKTLIFETGMLSEVSSDLYWKEEIRKNFNNDVEHLIKLKQLVGPRLKKIEIIGQLPIHNSNRPIIKISLHPLDSKYNIKENQEMFYGNMLIKNDCDYEILEEYRRTIGSRNQKLISLDSLNKPEFKLNDNYKIYDETIFFKLYNKINKEISFAKKIMQDRYKQIREFCILSKINHPKVLKLVGVSRKYGLIFPFLDWDPLDTIKFNNIINKDEFLKELDEFFAYTENKKISLGILDFDNEYEKERRLIDIVDLHAHNFLIKVEENIIKDWRVIDFEYYSNNNYQRNMIHKQNIFNKILNET